MSAGGTGPYGKIARSAARIPLDVHLRAFLSETASIPLAEGRMSDISLGGVHGSLQEDIGMGQRVYLEFHLPGSSVSMRVPCRVTHAHDLRFGFEFLELSLEQREHIRKVCDGLRGRT